jgi:hypothetical protein
MTSPNWSPGGIAALTLLEPCWVSALRVARAGFLVANFLFVAGIPISIRRAVANRVNHLMLLTNNLRRMRFLGVICDGLIFGYATVIITEFICDGLIRVFAG